jgi:hypothetical protein
MIDSRTGNARDLRGAGELDVAASRDFFRVGFDRVFKTAFDMSFPCTEAGRRTGGSGEWNYPH